VAFGNAGCPVALAPHRHSSLAGALSKHPRDHPRLRSLDASTSRRPPASPPLAGGFNPSSAVTVSSQPQLRHGHFGGNLCSRSTRANPPPARRQPCPRELPRGWLPADAPAYLMSASAHGPGKNTTTPSPFVFSSAAFTGFSYEKQKSPTLRCRQLVPCSDSP